MAHSPSLFLCSCLLGLSAVAHGMSLQERPNSKGIGRFAEADGSAPEWIQNVSHLLEIDEKVKRGNDGMAIEDMGAVVTFAGKRSVEYIDGAIMLGMSVKKHLPPNTPMVALVIEAMTKKMKGLLRGAGWTLVHVPNWDKEYCGKNCDMEFLGRWHDSFEKINAFRLPFKKVLFLDSDTYIFSPKIKELWETELPDGHIAMAKDGCKDEYNSGVMLYKPDLNVFTDMLNLVGQREREQILDQNLINEIYRGKVKEIPREFNCVDTLGTQPGLKEACKHHCSENMVVAHFTGHPKPTSAKRKQLALVRRPGAPAIACTNTNFGACMKWSSYYCDIHEHAKALSKNIRYWLKSTGGCCHTPFDPKHDDESCKECPATLEVKGDADAFVQATTGTYVKTTIPSTAFNGGRPIYKRMGKSPLIYMYFNQKQMLWMLGPKHDTATALGYAGKEAQCPRDAKAWSFFDGKEFVRRKFSLVALPNEIEGRLGAPNDTELIAWNEDSRVWEKDSMPEGFWETSSEKEKDE